MMSVDRRVRRSSARSVALSFFLEDLAERSGARAAVVCSEDGLLVGGVGDLDLDALAAVAPVVVAGTGSRREEGWIDDVAGGDDLYASTIVVGSRCLVLASVGGRLRKRREAAETIGRILGRD